MENLKAKDQMDMESFIEAAEHSFYHGSDLSVHVLSRMLKIPIVAWNSHFLWVSTPYISVYDCPVLVFYGLCQEFPWHRYKYITLRICV